jgi:DNA-binding transcriptional regulator GbsR (MarR family)
MKEIENNTKLKEQMVERMGIFFERQGLTPIHGRVFAFLLLAEPPHKDFYEIQEFLKASKSAVSNAIKFLQNAGLIEYITFSGDRRRYFRINTDGWLDLTKNKMKNATELENILEKALAARSDSKYLAFNEKLRVILDFNRQLGELMKQFIEKWDKNQQ